MSDANEAFPQIKNGRAKYPAVGERIYVPSGDEPHVIGGRGTVTELRGNSLHTKAVLVAEHPGVLHRWHEIRDLQFSLWEAFGMNLARLPNEDEKSALAARRAAAKTKAEAAREAAAAAERAKWAPQSFALLGGALVERPIAETHRRGRNWVALASFDPLIAGSIHRFWFERGGGKLESYILPPKLLVHDVVEFGADYIQGQGHRVPSRWYGVVLQITATHLVLQPCKDAMAAFKLSAENRREVPKESCERAVG